MADAYTIARTVNPMASTVNTVTRNWSDPSGTFNPFNDCDLTNPAANSKYPGQVGCGAINNPLFGQVTARTTSYDPAIVTGWGVRPLNWESQLSIQQQILPRVSVYAGYSRRWYGNLQTTQNLAVNNVELHAVLRSDPGRSPAAQWRRLSAVRDFDINQTTAAEQPDLAVEQLRQARGCL